MARLVIKVIEKGTSSPLSYARVEGPGVVSSLDQNGMAALEVPAGPALIKVRSKDYRPVSETLTAPGEYTIETEFARF